MGNCSFKTFYGRGVDVAQIMMDSGAIMQFKGPIPVYSVVKDFPGYGIFLRRDASAPLNGDDKLLNGYSYYLLPLIIESKEDMRTVSSEPTVPVDIVPGLDQALGRSSEPTMEVLPPKWEGMWRIKLVVSTDQLTNIFSQQANTEALIEKMSTAAKAKQAEDGQLSRCSSRRSVRSLIPGNST